jgi:hypothetical protein
VADLILAFLRFEMVSKMGAAVVAALILAACMYSPSAGAMAFAAVLLLTAVAGVAFVVELFRA